MKRIFLVIACILMMSCVGVPARAAILIESSNGSLVTNSYSASMALACTQTLPIHITSALSSSFSNISTATVHNCPIQIVYHSGGSLGNTTKFVHAVPPTITDLQRHFTGSGVVTGLTDARPEWFPASASSGINEAINASKVVKLSASTYTITTPIVIKSGTQLSGEGIGKSIISHLHSVTNLYGITDTTTQTVSSDNIILKDFEIQGDSQLTVGSATMGINLKNVNNLLLTHVKVGGFRDFGIRPGTAIAGSGGVGARGNKVVECIVDGVGGGDAYQHTGYDTQFIRNIARNYTDTGFAAGPDSFGISIFGMESGVLYDGNIIDGTTTGTPLNQLGYAFGPHSPTFNADIKIVNSTIRNCVQGFWGVSFSGLNMHNNSFYAGAATASGNVRLDGVSNFSITGGLIQGIQSGSGTGPDVAAIQFNSQRFTYGASIFDANTANGYVGGGLVIQAPLTNAIVIDVTNAVTGPSFTPTSKGITYDGINFGAGGTGHSIAYRVDGGNADQATDNNITNIMQSAGNFLSQTGSAGNYNRNVVNVNLPPTVSDQVAAAGGVFFNLPYLQGSGTPVSVVTPRYLGDNYFDISGGLWWKSFGNGITQWSKLSN